MIIAIVDDRKGPRQTLKRLFQAQAPDDVVVIDSAPLQKLSQYPSWLVNQKVGALIADERLYEQAADSESHVSYNGHELAQFLRSRLPDFPIFVITAYNDEALNEQSRVVEAIIQRDDFVADPQTYIDRIIRSASRFRSRFENDLKELGFLSEKIATGKSTLEEQQKAKAIQLAIGLDVGVQQITDKNEWLTQVESKLDDLKKAQEELKALITKSKK